MKQAADEEQLIEMGLRLNAMGRGGMLGSLDCPFALPHADYAKCPWYKPA